MRLTDEERAVLRRVTSEGGKARAKSLTKARRKEIGRMGGLAKAAAAKAKAS